MHPFWQGALQDLAHELQTDTVDVRESLRRSVANFTSSIVGEQHTLKALDQTDTCGDTMQQSKHNLTKWCNNKLCYGCDDRYFIM